MEALVDELYSFQPCGQCSCCHASTTLQGLLRILRTGLIIACRLHGTPERPRLRCQATGRTEAEKGERFKVYDEKRGLHGRWQG